MLKANSKVVKDRIRAYIMQGVNVEDYDQFEEPETFEQACKVIIDEFRIEKSGDYYKRYPEQEVFVDWCAGLPTILDTDYYLGVDTAVNILGDMLEETEEERSRFDNTDASDMLSRLIYRELIAGYKKGV